MRRSVALQRDEVAFEAKKKQLDDLKRKEDAGKLDLYYFDEAGFSTIPSVPYAWQPKGSRLSINSMKGDSLNVAGFMKRDGNFSSFMFDSSINGDVVIGVFDRFIADLDPLRKTVIVLDNASPHRSQAFEDKRDEWQERNVEIVYLSSYSPELNLIEHLWKAIKYDWLPFEAYLSAEHLRECLLDVLAKVGSELTISFA